MFVHKSINATYQNNTYLQPQNTEMDGYQEQQTPYTFLVSKIKNPGFAWLCGSYNLSVLSRHAIKLIYTNRRDNAVKAQLILLAFQIIGTLGSMYGSLYPVPEKDPEPILVLNAFSRVYLVTQTYLCATLVLNEIAGD